MRHRRYSICYSIRIKSCILLLTAFYVCSRMHLCIENVFKENNANE